MQKHKNSFGSPHDPGFDEVNFVPYIRENVVDDIFPILRPANTYKHTFEVICPHVSDDRLQTTVSRRRAPQSEPALSGIKIEIVADNEHLMQCEIRSFEKVTDHLP